MLRRLAFLFTVMAAVSGCSNEHRRTGGTQGFQAPLPIPSAPGAWDVTQYRSQAVQVMARSLPEGAHSQFR